MESRLVKREYKINDCRIKVTINGEESILGCCSAVIQANIIHKKIHMKNGMTYTARRDSYALVLCEQPEQDYTFDDLEKVERFDIILNMKDRFGEIEKIVENAQPVEIDLNGDWLFNLPEKIGVELVKKYKAMKENL